jgi:hypothetical protein
MNGFRSPCSGRYVLMSGPETWPPIHAPTALGRPCRLEGGERPDEPGEVLREIVFRGVPAGSEDVEKFG